MSRQRIDTQRLRECREAKGLSKTELGARINVGHNAISNWEAGRYGTSQANLQALGRALDVSPLYLTGQYAEKQTFEEQLAGQEPLPVSLDLAPDIPAWVDRLEASVTEVSRETSAAILHQEERFVGEMVRIGDQMERRDEQNAALLRSLVNVVQNNNTLMAETRRAIEDARQESRETREALARATETIAQLEERLLLAEGDRACSCASDVGGISSSGRGEASSGVGLDRAG